MWLEIDRNLSLTVGHHRAVAQPLLNAMIASWKQHFHYWLPEYETEPHSSLSLIKLLISNVLKLCIRKIIFKLRFARKILRTCFRSLFLLFHPFQITLAAIQLHNFTYSTTMNLQQSPQQEERRQWVLYSTAVVLQYHSEKMRFRFDITPDNWMRNEELIRMKRKLSVYTST